MSALYDCPAPAKLNLFLHVLGRRPDGYHQLQTAFQLLDHSDTLDFSLRNDNQIQRGNALPGVPPESDLTVRAARLLQQATGTHLGADITVHKRLPMGGGLGGGSSDAATTLIVLNHLWKTALSRQQLMSLGRQLGADVPFFLFGNNAFAEGIGEVLTPISTPPRWFVVLEPGISITTATIFSDPELTRNTKAVRITDFPDAGNYFSSGFGKNDLEVVAAKRFSPVGESLKWLRKHGNQDARMTGSGACIFCSFLHEEQADEVLDQVPSQWIGWKARALKEHPLAHLTSW